MTDRFVDGEEEVRWVQHEVVLARLHALGRQFLAGLLGRRDNVLLEVIAVAI